MVDVPTSSFEDPRRHAGVSEIIRRTSTNQTDVRQAVLDGLDLSFAKTILDLGCGFGFMTDTVAARAAPDARIVGVDVCAANEQPYLERLASTGRSASFVCRCVDRRLDWPDHSFDLVLASYSLYFFPDVLPEVPRVLKPQGLLVAVTHTESSCRELLRAAGLRETNSRLLGVIDNFSADNAGRRLTPWFGDVQRIDYRNTLVFEPAQYDDFLRYLWFKLPFLSYDSEGGGQPTEPLATAIRASLSRQPRVVFEKSDAAFHCRKPRWP